MFSTSFPRSLWFFLQVVTIINFISNLSSNSKEPSKYPKVFFMTNLWNWQSSKLLFHKVGFPRNSFGISVTTLPVSICLSKSNLLILIFSIMSFFFCSIFFYILVFVFTEKSSILVSFSSTFSTIFFLNLHITWKCFFLSNVYQSSKILGIFFLFISCSRLQYEHSLAFLTWKYRWIFLRRVDFHQGCISVLILVAV